MENVKIRLYVDHSLGEGQSVPLTRDQAHYLSGVMRRKAGDGVLVFNGRDGEFLARITTLSKRDGALACERQTRPLQMPPDLWLLFAPIKKTRTDFIVEKAAELGVARIVPIRTEFTNTTRIRLDRLQAHAVEAAEQCGGTFVPEVAPLQPLASVLANWPDTRRLMFCDEHLAGRKTGLEEGPAKQPWAIAVGPEGGFSDGERARFQAMPGAVSVSLGPRILRADTAAVAALTYWQSRLGDW